MRRSHPSVVSPQKKRKQTVKPSSWRRGTLQIRETEALTVHAPPLVAPVAAHIPLPAPPVATHIPPLAPIVATQALPPAQASVPPLVAEVTPLAPPVPSPAAPTVSTSSFFYFSCPLP